MAKIAAFATVASVALVGGALAESPPTDPALKVYAAPQKLVALPDGRRMNVYCLGTGTPTVILEGGWTATTVGWRKVQPMIAATTRVCSYDRAGYGFSDPGPLPRTAAVLASDLRATLRAAALPGPYIIVGHSLGSFVARLYSDHNRRDVAGLVLVDPSAAHQNARLAVISPATAEGEKALTAAVVACANGVIAGTLAADDPARRACVDPPSRMLPASVSAAHLVHQLRPSYQRTAVSELTSLEDIDSAQIDASRRSWGALPLVVLTADGTTDDPAQTPDEQAALRKTWWNMHEDIAHLSSKGVNRLVLNSSHFIPSQHPEAVIAAVTEIVAAVRSRPAK